MTTFTRKTSRKQKQEIMADVFSQYNFEILNRIPLRMKRGGGFDYEFFEVDNGVLHYIYTNIEAQFKSPYNKRGPKEEEWEVPLDWISMPEPGKLSAKKPKNYKKKSIE